MVIMAACGLPDPSMVDYDLLLVCVPVCDSWGPIIYVQGTGEYWHILIFTVAGSDLTLPGFETD